MSRIEGNLRKWVPLRSTFTENVFKKSFESSTCRMEYWFFGVCTPGSAAEHFFSCTTVVNGVSIVFCGGRSEVILHGLMGFVCCGVAKEMAADRARSKVSPGKMDKMKEISVLNLSKVQAETFMVTVDRSVTPPRWTNPMRTSEQKAQFCPMQWAMGSLHC